MKTYGSEPMLLKLITPLEDVFSGISVHQGEQGYNEPNRAEPHLIL